MKIRLNEIPQDGREYTFDRKSGELDQDLKDLVGDRAYEASFFIKPIGQSAYELRGNIKTTVNEVCSNCGYDMELPIDRKMNEVLFEDHEEYRKSHSVHGNQSVDFTSEGPSMTPYKGNVFDAGAFLHEAVALDIPFYPMCGEKNTCLRASEVEELKRRLEGETEFEPQLEQASPFRVLKGLNLSKKN